MRVRALIVVLLLSIAGCSGVGVVPGGTSESLLGTASTATDTADATSSARPDSTPTTVVQHYPVSRNPRHTLLVLGGEPGGAYPGPAIYTWDVELRRSAPIYDLPEGAHILSAALSSPDASRVVLYGYDADGDQTERLLQVDLVTGEIVGLDLHRGTDWLIPIVPGRRPGEEYENEVLRAPLEHAIGVLGDVIWSPDSGRFAFVMGLPGGTLEGNNNAQIYLVEWGEASAIPLATEAPGNDVGLSAAWSPSGRYISYIQGYPEESIWIIDLDKPSTAHRLVDQVQGENVRWLPSADAILYSEFDDVLASVAVPTGETVVFAESPHILGHFVEYDLIGPTGSGAGYFIQERSWYEDESELGEVNVLFLDLVTGLLHTMIRGGEFTSAFPLPAEPWLWLLYTEPMVGTIVAAPDGATIAASSEDRSLRLPIEELERQYGVAGVPLSISPDANLAVLEHNDRLMIWDVLTGEYTEVAPDIPGDKTFIGWIPDPDAWEAALAAGAP